MNLVTTCTEAGWNKFGRRFCDTFAKHWPGSATLYLYAEGFDPREEVAPNVIVRSLLNDCPDLVDFKARHANNPEAHGMIRGRYDYAFDCVRWCHRIFALDAAVRDYSLHMPHIINIDCDIVTFADVPERLADDLLGDAEIAYMPRNKIKMYSECSFVVYRLNDKVKDFIHTHKECYMTGAVFSLPRWTDSHVFDWMLPKFGIKTADINMGVKGSMHPFVNGPLGAYMDHLKGNRKEDGKSRSTDLVRTRTEAYWQ